MDNLMAEIVLAEAIRDDVIVVQEGEAALIKDKLIAAQNEKLGECIAAGIPEGYITFSRYTKTKQYNKDALVSQQTTGFNAESEMEYLIDSFVKRDDEKSDRIAVLKQQLDWVTAAKKSIQDTVYKTYAEEVRNKYETYLKNKISGNNSFFTDISKLSNRAANYFKSLGLKKGDVVMLILRRRWEYWIRL